jgi:hypothetical protein
VTLANGAHFSTFAGTNTSATSYREIIHEPPNTVQRLFQSVSRSEWREVEQLQPPTRGQDACSLEQPDMVESQQRRRTAQRFT